MSLVTTYVESKEGHWYDNPVVEGEGWYICWDDDDPIELVIDKSSGLYAQTVLNRLKKRGWTLTIMCKVHEGSQRMFGGKFKPAHSYFLIQYRNGPTDKMLEGNKCLDKKPSGQGVYYSNTRNGNGGLR